MNDKHVAEFVAAEASAPHRHMGQDMADILNAVVEASTRKVGELDAASLDRALSSVIPRMKKVRLGDAPRMIGAFLEWAGGAAGLKDAGALAKEAVRRGEEIAREDEKKRAPVVNKAPVVNRNDPCPCGSGKKYKKCCGT